MVTGGRLSFTLGAVSNNKSVSYEELIQRSEKEAADAADPEKLDFLDFLENGGIIMPHSKPDAPIKVFLDANVVREMLDLRDEADKLQQQANLNAEESLRRDRENLFEQIRSDERRAYAVWKVQVDALREQDKYASVGDTEPEEPVMPPIRTADEITVQVEKELPAVGVPTPPRVLELVEQINTLTKQAYQARLEIHLEGVQPAKVRDYLARIEDELRQPLQAQLSEEDRLTYQSSRTAAELISGSIIEIYNPRTDTREDFRKQRMSPSAARRLITLLPQTEMNKLLEAANVFTNAAVLLDLQTDAGFPGGRAEPPEAPALDAGDQDGEGME